MWAIPRFILAPCVQVNSGPCCQLDDCFKRHYSGRSVDVFIAIFVYLISWRAVCVTLLSKLGFLNTEFLCMCTV